MQNNDSKLKKSNFNRNSLAEARGLTYGRAKFEIRNYILYLDTSEPEARIAIYRDGQPMVEERWLAHRELSATLSGKYTEILKTAGLKASDLGGIAVFLGPGSFTGLRIGISFANALAYALRVPVYGTLVKGEIDTSTPAEFVTPVYGAEPNITAPKK